MDKSGTAKTLQEVEARPGVRWDILDRYFRREDLLKENFVRDKLTEMENKIALDEQKYLHLCIETRPYLWISSGILVEKKQTVLEELVKKGFEILEVIEEGEWCAIVAKQ